MIYGISADDIPEVTTDEEVFNLLPDDEEVVFSYESDKLAQTLKGLDPLLVGSTVYVTEHGYIIHEGRVYIPFAEARRVFCLLYDEDRKTRYVDLRTYFTKIVYSPNVKDEHMREWFRDCQKLTLRTISWKLPPRDMGDAMEGDEVCVEPPPSCINPVNCKMVDLEALDRGLVQCLAK